MTDEESRFARKVAGCLDRGVADLRSGTVYRLQQARARENDLSQALRSEETRWNDLIVRLEALAR